MSVYCERILVVCRWGLVRSVALREVLINELGVDVIAAGLEKNSFETLSMLGGWADRIIVASTHLMNLTATRALPIGKVTVLDLGRDHWQNARHPDLMVAARHHLSNVLDDIRRTRRSSKPYTSRLVR